MVAPNSRSFNAFTSPDQAPRNGGGLPDRIVRAAADRGILSQLEFWLDFCENQDREGHETLVPGRMN